MTQPEKSSLSPVQEEAPKEIAALRGVFDELSAYQVEKTVEACGIEAFPAAKKLWDEITLLRMERDEARKALSGSISERETLTAQLEKTRGDYATSLRLANETTEAAIAERDTFRDWFQNAEQARAVAEANVERLTREKAQLVTQLEAAKQFGEAPTNG